MYEVLDAIVETVAVVVIDDVIIDAVSCAIKVILESTTESCSSSSPLSTSELRSSYSDAPMIELTALVDAAGTAEPPTSS